MSGRMFRGFPRAIKDKGDAQVCLSDGACPICGSDVEEMHDYDETGPTAWFACTARYQIGRKKKIHHVYRAEYDGEFREYNPVLGDDYGR